MHKVKEKNKKSRFYEVTLVILTLSVIASIIIMIYLEKPSTYKLENGEYAINTLLTVTDNVINKIYNIVVILTLYITVIIATFSLFQFSRNREYEKLKDDMNNRIESEIVNLKNENEFLKSELEKRIDMVIDKTQQSNYELNILNRQMKIELLEVKVTNETKENSFYSSVNIRKYYDEIFDIINNDPMIVTDEKRANIFSQIGYHNYYYDMNKSESAYIEALKYSKDKNLDSNIFFNLALIESSKKNYDKSFELYKKSIEANRFNFGSYIELILVCDKIGYKELQKEFFNDYIVLTDTEKNNRLSTLIIKCKNDEIISLCKIQLGIV